MGNIKETGNITSRMVLEILFINQEIFIVVLGLMAKNMDKEFINTPTEQNMMEHGMMIKDKVKVN